MNFIYNLDYVTRIRDETVKSIFLVLISICIYQIDSIN